MTREAHPSSASLTDPARAFRIETLGFGRRRFHRPTSRSNSQAMGFGSAISSPAVGKDLTPEIEGFEDHDDATLSPDELLGVGDRVNLRHTLRRQLASGILA